MTSMNETVVIMQCNHMLYATHTWSTTVSFACMSPFIVLVVVARKGPLC